MQFEVTPMALWDSLQTTGELVWRGGVYHKYCIWVCRFAIGEC